MTNDGDYPNVVHVSNLAMTENMPTTNISSNSVPKTALSAKVSVSDMVEFQVNTADAVETAPTVNIVAPNVTNIDTSRNMHVVCSNAVQEAEANPHQNGTYFSAHKKHTTSSHPTPFPNNTVMSNDVGVLAAKNYVASSHNMHAADNQLQFDTKATPTQNAHTTYAAENLHFNRNIMDTSKYQALAHLEEETCNSKSTTLMKRYHPPQRRWQTHLRDKEMTTSWRHKEKPPRHLKIWRP
ncbi:hypothetical protein Salat_2727900 [Sesamum alatum]|uniref:Uncharacterized protein n=1 Tax=Sesamum alatum TaxID=300844 RepID=A0AAE1XK22_9LAMI|nr:hypothetical protein Salat_2727900 [Sesamum alatum]